MKSIQIQKNVKVITSREEVSIDQYFRDISKIKLLSEKEEKELGEQIKCGGIVGLEARDKLIKSNLRFVISVAKQYQNKGVLLLDLINEGNIGLIHAAETFDESRGFRFISYAVYWIRRAILAALTEQSHMIHIPFNQYYLHSRVKKIFEEEKAKGKDVTEEDIANILKVDAEDIFDVLKSNDTINYTVSLNNTLSSEDEKGTLIDVIKNENIKSPDTDLMVESMREDVEKILNKVLDEREKQVISMNYGLGGKEAMSFQEISDRLGLTKECIRQIKEKAMRKLRLFEGNKILRQYL